MSSVSREKAKDNIQLASNANPDAAELRLHGNGADDCRSLLEDSRDEAPAVEGFAKEVVRTRGDYPASEAVLYKNDFLAVLRRQMRMSLTQDVFFSLHDDLKHFGRPLSPLHRLDTD